MAEITPFPDKNEDLFAKFRSVTRARVGLGRAGDGLPTKPLLEFQMAHAKARDAVNAAADFASIATALSPLPVVEVHSAADNRAIYLRRPDLGRQLRESDRVKFTPAPCDVAFVVADGLSAAAVNAHAAEMVKATAALLAGVSIGPIVLANQGRVAIGDDIGDALGARLVIVLIGERPGLTAADSLGAYLTFAPKPGTQDSARNCISNIHGGGLSIAEASHKAAWLAREALRIGETGIGLKDDAPSLVLLSES